MFDSARRCVVLLIALVAGGCAVGPNFRPPVPAVPDRYVGAAPTSQPASGPDVELAAWWTAFGDPMLTSLIERGRVSNLDVQLAQARILAARASRGVAIGGLGPSVNANGSFSRGQGSANGGPVQAPTANQYQAGFDAAWEIDVFGGARRGVEAASADLRAAVENRHSVLVSLSAEIARNYIDLRTGQRRIALARKNLDLQTQSLELTRKRLAGGLVGRLDLANAEAQVASTTAAIPLLELSVRQTIYAISVLLGEPPGTLLGALDRAEPGIPALAGGVPLGLPSDLVRRRPDVRSAEAAIHAATARVGVATADLFPKFNFSAAVAYRAPTSSGLFDSLNRSWSFGPSVSWDLFNTGRNLSNVQLQKMLTEQTVISYRQVVLIALQDVENALIASAKEQEHLAALTKATAANRQAVDIATKLYRVGETEFLNVLDAQRSLLVSEDAEAQSIGAVSTDLVALFKALGGGWAAGEK